jgi:hypothetical protein
MTDQGESELRKWALDRPNGDVIKPQDIVKLIFAFDDDNTKKHEEVMSRLSSGDEKFLDQEARIHRLEDWRVRLHDHGDDRLKGLISAEHAKRHSEYVNSLHQPRRQEDPPDSEFLEHRESAFPHDVQSQNLYQVVAAWSLFKKGLAIVLTALLIGLTGIGVSYVGSLFASSKVEGSIIHTDQLITPEPTVTVTVSPSP